jgi:hypothetical protein
MPPYSIKGSLAYDKWVYMVNPYSSTGYVPSMLNGAPLRFNCDNKNLNGDPLVTTQKWAYIRNQLFVGNPALYPRGTSDSGFWLWMASHTTGIKNDAILQNTLQALAGDSTAGLAMACGCENIDPEKILIQNG